MSAVGPERANEVTLSLHGGSNIIFTASFAFLLLLIFIIYVAFTFCDVAMVEVTVFLFDVIVMLVLFCHDLGHWPPCHVLASKTLPSRIHS